MHREGKARLAGLSFVADRQTGARGPVDSGLVLAQQLQAVPCDLWGDTVNMASRLESHGTPSSARPHHRAEMSAITELFAGVPVSDLDASIEWYAVLRPTPGEPRGG
jgi:class 3 adenylate cyclase